MKHSAILWSLCLAYFFVLGVIYQIVSGEAGGTVLLLFAAAFGGLIAGWLWHASRAPVAYPEDDPVADAGDATGVVGVFTSESIRPLGIAAGMSAVFLGVAVGLWMSVAGVAILVSQVALVTWDTDR